MSVRPCFPPRELSELGLVTTSDRVHKKRGNRNMQTKSERRVVPILQVRDLGVPKAELRMELPDGTTIVGMEGKTKGDGRKSGKENNNRGKGIGGKRERK